MLASDSGLYVLNQRLVILISIYRDRFPDANIIDNVQGLKLFLMQIGSTILFSQCRELLFQSPDNTPNLWKIEKFIALKLSK